MKDEPVVFPKYLDEPPRWLFWTLDEAMVLLAPLMLGLLLFNSFILSFCIGVMLMLMLKKIKGVEGHFFLLSLAYWYLPHMKHTLKATPPSYLREYLG